MRSLRHLLMVLLVTVLGFNQPGLAVLCISDGWHVAIEVGPACCSPSASTVAAPQATGTLLSGADGTCCGPCADIPLGVSDHAVAGSPRNEAPQAPSLQVFAPLIEMVGQPCLGRSLAHACFHSRATRPRPPLETTALRC